MILTKEQRDAVLHDSHVVLTACPGSGKTRTLVAKLLRCVSELRDTPRRVACITYTNAAVHEIEHRLHDYCIAGDEALCDISTIHTFCLDAILRPFHWRIPAFQKGFSIAAPESEVFVRACKIVCEKHDIDEKALDSFELLNRHIDGSPICPEDISPEAATDFWSILADENCLDFCSIVYWSYNLLQNWSPVGDSIASRYSWILVDEFQDTSEVQVEIFLAIAARARTNFFAVGDPYQSIFGFSGARPELMTRFKNEIKASDEFHLASNFRSSRRIINQAQRLFDRRPSMIAAGKTVDHEHEPVHVTSESKFDGIADYFLPAIEEQKIRYGEVAILAPSWFVLVPVAKKLREYGIPVVGPGARPYSKQRLFARFAEHICAYIENPKPGRIPEIEKELFMLLSSLNGKADLRVFSYDGRRAVYDLIKAGSLIRDRCDGGVEWLLQSSSSFADVMLDHRLTGSGSKDLLVDSVHLMINDMHKRNTDVDNLTLADIGMFACPDDNVKLLTLHSSKGREFDAVAVIDVHEGKMPNWKDEDDQAKVEESKRLFYVGMTRARCLLYFISDTSHPKNRPTRFLSMVSPRRITKIVKV